LGEFLELLKRSGYTATGCDGNISQIKYVQSLGFKARLADLERELPFEANSFEVISCLEVIEHISRAEALLAEMGRVLVPGGHLVLTTPNYLFWRERVGHLMGQPPTGEGIHLRFFTPRTLTAAMKKAGFELVARASYGPCTGLNFFRRLFSLEDVHIILPALWENCLAYNLAYLCRRLR
jgi:SAM-dependent methyltransferase